jgi:ABC-type enterochelin transport system permease subunit
MLHLLLLAFGGAFVTELFNTVANRERLTLSVLALISVVAWLRRIYSKSDQGTKKRRQ